MNNFTFVYTEQAENDLRNILDYIEFKLNSPQAAKNLLLSVKEKIANICKEPKIYPTCLYKPLASKNIRFALAKNFKIYFAVDTPQNRIIILYIKHCLQDEQNLTN